MDANRRPITAPPRLQAGVPGARLFYVSAKYIFRPVLLSSMKYHHWDRTSTEGCP